MMQQKVELVFQKFLYSLPIWGTLLVIFAGLSGMLAIIPGMNQDWVNQVTSAASRFSAVFLGIFIEAVPFLLLGTLASGLVEEFIPASGLASWFPKNPLLAAWIGSFTGIFFPVCECGVIPFGRRLLRKGIPLPAGIATMLAAAVVNPIVLASTFAAFGFGVVFWGRILATILIATTASLLLANYPGMADQVRSLMDRESPPVHSLTAAAGEKKSNRFGRTALVAVDEFFEMGRYLVVGALLAAFLQTFIPQSRLTEISQGPILSVITLQGVAVLLSICSTVDAFVALAFTGVFTSGSILGFLVFGPMVDIKSLFMYLRVFKPGFVITLVMITFMMTLVIGAALNYLWV